VCDELTVGIVTELQYDIRCRLQKLENKDMGSGTFIHPNYFSRVRVRVRVLTRAENKKTNHTSYQQDQIQFCSYRVLVFNAFWKLTGEIDKNVNITEVAPCTLHAKILIGG